jgi:hypothetical protein
MKKITSIALASIATIGSSLANAQSSDLTGFYAELGILQAYYKDSVANVNNTMGSATLGYSINQYASFEILGAGALNEASFYYGTTKINAKTSSAYGGYAKGTLPIDDKFGVFVKIGATNGTVTASSAYGSGWSSGTSFSYGGGIQINFNKNVYGIAQYMSYYGKNSVTIVAPSIGIGYKF